MTISVVPTEHDAWGSKHAKAMGSCGRYESFMTAAKVERDAACEKKELCRKTEELGKLYFITNEQAMSFHARASSQNTR